MHSCPSPPGAVSNISRIEVQYAQGNWEVVWFERTLAGAPKLINAVRLGFVLEKPSMLTGAAQLLRAR